MINLTDHQRKILTAASQHPHGRAWPFPFAMNRGGITMLLNSLTKRGLIEEIDAEGDEPFWGSRSRDQRITFRITDAGRAAIGADVQPAAEPNTRADSKQAQLLSKLRSPDGASIAELAAALNWQPHSVRGFIAGVVKKKLGLLVLTAKIYGRGTVYRLVE